MCRQRTAMRRFLREIDGAAAPDIPTSLRSSIAVLITVCYLVTEFVEGADAAKLRRSWRPTSCGETVSISRSRSMPFRTLTRWGFIHRDIKTRTSWSAAPGESAPPSSRTWSGQSFSSQE